MPLPAPPSRSRRSVLTGVTAAIAASAGCVSTARQLGDSSATEPVTLEIKTLPDDIDPYAARIGRHLKTALEAVGIATHLRPVSRRGFYREILVDNEFEIYIGRFPYQRRPDPDVLYPLFRSSFTTDSGWQNPFGFISFRCDQLLDRQRAADSNRAEALGELQELLAETQPIVPLVHPELPAAIRTDRFTGWSEMEPTHPRNLLQLDPPSTDSTLRLGTTNRSITTDWNPITTRLHQDSSLTELLYDSLAIDDGDETIPWLARDITWEHTADGPLRAVVQLRDRIRWHDSGDSRYLTAEDVKFTYDFLRDTSLGRATIPIPATRFASQLSVVESVSVPDSQQANGLADKLTVEFTATNRSVAERALTVPILPRQIWTERTTVQRVRGNRGETTAALSSNNPSPVGSGPIQFVEATADRQVTFSIFEDHFLWRDDEERLDTESHSTESVDAVDNQSAANTSDEPVDNRSAINESATNQSISDVNRPESADQRAVLIDTAPLPNGYDDRIPFDELVIEVASSDNAIVELLVSGGIDATAAPLGTGTVSRILEADGVELIETVPSGAFYHLGFNTRRLPLRNPHFRRAVGRLVNTERIAEEICWGDSRPATTPLGGTGWTATATVTADQRTPFIGADGELDDEAARTLFSDLGYRYDTDGQLVSPS